MPPSVTLVGPPELQNPNAAAPAAADAAAAQDAQLQTSPEPIKEIQIPPNTSNSKTQFSPENNEEGIQNPPDSSEDRENNDDDDDEETDLTGTPPKGLTENLAPTYLTSGNPCLDFFFHVVPNTPSESINDRLELAWKHNPLTTLKLICHLRGVRNTGKTDKQGFYTAALWLHNHHPKTLAGNLKHIVDFGYFKDLPELLYRLLNGPDVRDKQDDRKRVGNRFVWLKNKRGKTYYERIGGEKSSEEKKRFETLKEKRAEKERMKKVKEERDERIKGEREWSREKRLEVESMKVKLEVEDARKLRKGKKIELAKKAIEKYIDDGDYRGLHDIVCEVFAVRLVADLQALKSGEVGKIGLAAKWCPSLNSSFDRATLICEGIARRVFLRETYPEYEGVEEVHYAYRVRDRLRKEVLVPLRRVLELPELYMSLNDWNSLPYNRVASVAMTKYKKHFLKHDQERFKEYLKKVKKGEAKIAAGALLPHEIIKEALAHYDECGEVAELQWQRMVNDLLEKGKLRNCLAICDVSGSMSGTPMDVSVALGLLISELSEDPWKGNVITFSENPELHKIEGDNLKSKTEFVRDMDWGGNTDFQKVFDRILEVAVNGKLSKEQMIKKVFVFSDMEFDQAAYKGTYDYDYNEDTDSYEFKSSGDWDTNYEVIQKRFEESGYELPQIVFWNLRDSMATPVTANQKGVAMVSGFSKNMMTLFLEEDDELLISNPENVMNEAISGPEFSQLVVLD